MSVSRQVAELLLMLLVTSHVTSSPVLHTATVLTSLFTRSPLLVLVPHLSRPRTSSSSSRITNRSFRYASPHLWNQLPASFRQPCINHPVDDVTPSNSSSTCAPLSPSVTHSLLHSRLKTHLFHRSFPPESASTHPNCLLRLYRTVLERTYGAQRFFIFSYFSFFLFF